VVTIGQSPSSKNSLELGLWPSVTTVLEAEEQHRRIVAVFKAQGCSKVSLRVILMGVMGTNYSSHTDIPLNKLGLDYCKAKKLTEDLNTLYTVCNKNC